MRLRNSTEGERHLDSKGLSISVCGEIFGRALKKKKKGAPQSLSKDVPYHEKEETGEERGSPDTKSSMTRGGDIS